MWVQNVVHFADIEGAAEMLVDSWRDKINIVFVGLIAFHAQSFFRHRLWVCSTSPFLPIPLMALR
jgi:hypothetical protein